MGKHFGIVAILSIIFLMPLIVEGQEVVLTCGDECVEDGPQQKSQMLEISSLMGLDEPVQCWVEVTWNEAEVCPEDGGGCVFELVKITYPDNCAYSPEDVYHYALLAFLLLKYNDNCSNIGPDGCVDNVRLYTGDCAKRVYINGQWELQRCITAGGSPCCKSVYRICYVNFRYQLIRTHYYSPSPTCSSFGMSWMQVGGGCYPVCELLPENWYEDDPS